MTGVGEGSRVLRYFEPSTAPPGKASRCTMAATATPRGRPSNEELLRKPPQEILRWLQKVEAENLKLMFDHGTMMREVNRRMQVSCRPPLVHRISRVLLQ